MSAFHPKRTFGVTAAGNGFQAMRRRLITPVAAPHEVGTRPNPKPAIQRTLSFSLGAEARRVFVSALGLGRRRKRVWHHAKSTPTSSKASERPHGQANSMTAITR